MGPITCSRSNQQQVVVTSDNWTKPDERFVVLQPINLLNATTLL